MRGFCDPAWLRRNLLPNSLVLSDCEGFEGELFATAAPALDSATLLVEVHDMFVPGVSDRLRRRFAGTHDITATASTDHPPPAIDLSFLTADERHRAVHEVRPDQEWLLMTPKRPAGDPPGAVRGKR